jgi:hypothetical protein
VALLATAVFPPLPFTVAQPGITANVLGMPARRLREDRLLHEAEATGGDPRRICDLFGLSVGAVLRYTATVDQTGLAEYNLRYAGPRPKARADGDAPES